MTVTLEIGGETKTAKGSASNKKKAKHVAAYALLQQLPKSAGRKKRKKGPGFNKGPIRNQRRRTPMPAATLHADLAQLAEEAYAKYEKAASCGDDTADKLYDQYRIKYQKYADEYAKSYKEAQEKATRAAAAGP